MKNHILDSKNCKRIWRYYEELDSSAQLRVQEETVVCHFNHMEHIDMQRFFGGHRIWTLAKGELHLMMRDMEGKTIVFLKFTPENAGSNLLGQYISALDYGIEAVCVGETDLCYIPEKLSGELYREYSSVRRWQATCSIDIMGRLLELINDLSFLSLKERLEKRLKEYFTVYQKDTVVITHEALAEELGTSREVISRLLKKMEAEHTIAIRRKSIQILQGIYRERGA